jgi:hypothetical protein
MVVESVVPETPEFDIGKWMDLDMMVMATGRERTAAEFRDRSLRPALHWSRSFPPLLRSASSSGSQSNIRIAVAPYNTHQTPMRAANIGLSAGTEPPSECHVARRLTRTLMENPRPAIDAVVVDLLGVTPGGHRPEPRTTAVVRGHDSGRRAGNHRD